MEKLNVMNLAKWLIKNNYDTPRNHFDGNMKLQKLLYFAQLIHIVKHGETLYDEPVYAFKNGSVVDIVRQNYQYNNSQFIESANIYNPEFSDEQNETINLTLEIFGDISARELSEINHEQILWKSSYERSKDPISNYHHTELSLIDFSSIPEQDLYRINEVLKAYEDAVVDEFEVINGIKFYYDPTQIQINEEILNELEAFDGSEDAYSIYFDENRGLVIY